MTSAEYNKDSQKKAWMMGGPVGMVAGLFGSLVGVGGGVLIVPIITGASGAVTVPQRIVTGSSLAAVISTGSVAALTYSDFGQVDFQAAAVLSAAAVLFAPAGARLTSRMDCNSLKKVLGYFLVGAGPLVLVKFFAFGFERGAQEELGTSDTPEGFKAEGGAPRPQEREWISMTTAMLAGTGACAGLASGLLGIGGGTIVTPLLALFTPLSQATIVGTSLLAMIPPSFVGLIQHNSLGNVDKRLAMSLAAGTAFGSMFGSNLAVRAPEGLLECLFGLGMDSLAGGHCEV
eukprot:CAMPEP_0196573910 /NCGR_PEP_ID=MMETSP1081-20130531/3729_1 /TAXON_ID=36882 /ORGANISM="Pyramimonas amylifera, Strain CCMP720" /LENGTH=288 /DNA_ID=CAMNT_0041891763 /DNA_START=44 /DNA_END=911 /DNA_ORIENTATION=-